MRKYIVLHFIIGIFFTDTSFRAQNPDVSIYNALVNAVNNGQITHELGLKKMDTLLTQYPKFAKGYVFRGKLYYGIRQFPDALLDCDKAIVLDSTLQESYEYRGRIYLELKDYPNAIKDFTTSLRIRPLAETYNIRGFVYLQRRLEKDLSDAIKDFKTALKLNKKLEVACINLKEACELCAAKYEKEKINNCEGCCLNKKSDINSCEACDSNAIIRLAPLPNIEETTLSCLEIQFQLKKGSPQKVQIKVNNQVVQPCMNGKSLSKTIFGTSIALQIGLNQVEIMILDEEQHSLFQTFTITRVEKRLALLIGNKDYLTAPLRNPINDMDSMAAILIQKKFEIIKAKNLPNEAAFEVQIDAFIKQGIDKNVLLFFFAGHGHEIDMIPYMEGTLDGFKQGFSIKTLFAKLKRVQSVDKNKLFIIIIDACRSYIARDPIVELESLMPENTIVGFGTFSGEKALDGCGDNGCYTKALLKAIQTPNLSLNDVFNKARELVESFTKKWQTSVEKNRLKSNIFIF